jgi:hypothetical protein
MGALAWLLPVLALLIGGTITAGLGYFAYRIHARRQMLVNMPVTRIEDLEPGPAKVKARVVATGKLLRTPMHEHECVFYRFVVNQRHVYDKVENVVTDEGCVAVRLEDATGEARIDLSEAKVALQSKDRRSSNEFREAPEYVRDLLRDRYGVSSRGVLFNKALTCIESWLENDGRVVVVGEVRRGKDGTPVFRAGATPLVVCEGSDSEHLKAPYLLQLLICLFGVLFAATATLMAVVFSGFIAALLSR